MAIKELIWNKNGNACENILQFIADADVSSTTPRQRTAVSFPTSSNQIDIRQLTERWQGRAARLALYRQHIRASYVHTALQSLQKAKGLFISLAKQLDTW